MRLKRNRLKELTLKRFALIEDEEGGRYEGYEEEGTTIQLEVFNNRGRTQAQIYGTRLDYMLSCLYQGNVTIKEKDGVCVYVKATEKPDYKVVSIIPYSQHTLIELELIRYE